MKKNLVLIILAISVITIISGLSQVFMPDMVLNLIGAEVSPLSSHLFGIVGMFMALFGSLMIHTIYINHPSIASVFWCAMQKLGAFVAVSIGVLGGLFSWMASFVAIFDLFSGLLFLYFIKTFNPK